MNFSLSFPRPTKRQIWILPFCYLIVGFAVQASVQFIYSRPSTLSIDHLLALQEPLLLLLTTALLWIALRLALRKVHCAVVSHLISASQLCKLSYYRSKASVHLRNQIIVSGLITLCLILFVSQNTQLLVYPGKPGFMLILVIFIIVNLVFMMQCATLPGFLRTHFFSTNITSVSALHSACHFYRIHTFVTNMLCFALILWGVGAIVLSHLAVFFLLASLVCLTVLLGLFIGRWRMSAQMQNYKSEALQSNKRKLHFLRNSKRYPEQALQLAINKLRAQREILLDCDCAIHNFKIRKTVGVTFGALLVVWFLAL